MLAAKLKVNKGLIVNATEHLGSKLLMSGGGRCNITHDGSIKDFVDCYGESGRKLRKCLYKHSNIELVDWLQSCGISTVSQDGRVFPQSMKARDILDMLINLANNNGWEFKLNTRVIDIAEYRSMTDALVIATGGITYPQTGSDGSMFKALEKCGIAIVEPKSALAPIHVKNYPYSEISGVSVSDVTVTAFSSDITSTCKGKAARMTGDLLFTHNGFSGPVILNISRYAEPGETIRICYNKEYESLPKSFQKILAHRSIGQSGDIKTSKLAALLESDEFIVDYIDSNGMVTRGGISLDEIDFTTMQLKKLPGIYAIGEALDVDGITGGYNLQMCYSTACAVADTLNNK